MTNSLLAPLPSHDYVRLKGKTLHLYDEALRSFREDLSRMGAGMMSAAEPLEEGAGSLAGVNQLMAYVARLSGRTIALLVDRPDLYVSTQYPLTSTRLLERELRRDGGDPELVMVLRVYAQLALLFPDMLGPGRGGGKGDFVEVRCRLVPELLAAVSDWLRTKDAGRSRELAMLVDEWNAVTGWS